MKRFVLCTWAVLKMLEAEGGAAFRVRQIVEGALREDFVISTLLITLGEDHSIVGKARG